MLNALRRRSSVLLLERAPFKALPTDIHRVLEPFQPHSLRDLAQRYLPNGQATGKWALQFESPEAASSLLTKVEKKGLLVIGSKPVTLRPVKKTNNLILLKKFNQ